MPNDKYRVVLTCYDSNRDVPPYAEAITRFFEDNESGEAALNAAEEECRSLMDGFEGEGSFQVSEGGARSCVAVNWYSIKVPEMDEATCDIKPVTEYNIYPVHFYGPEDKASCFYRGFEVYINQNQHCYSVRHHDTQLAIKYSLTDALTWIDDLLLEIELSKSDTLKSLFSPTTSLDNVVKNAVSKCKDINKNVGFDKPKIDYAKD